MLARPRIAALPHIAALPRITALAGLAALSMILALSAVPMARADTVLDLSDTATVSAQPDEITASLRAEVTAPTPAAAQQAVNQMMAAGLQTAKQAPQLRAQTGAYSVWQPDAQHPGPAPDWRASQTLDLSGRDGPVMLDLVGKLQGQGMAVQALSWRLSDPLSRATQAAALRQAISGLRSRAEDAAKLLGLHFASFRTVRLNPEARPFPMQVRAAAFAATPPSVEQGPIEVSATVTAEVVLVP